MQADKIINQYALKLTATVIISRTLYRWYIYIICNSRMIYDPSKKKINFRYNGDNCGICTLHNICCIISGLIQEFDDEIEEIFTDLLKNSVK